MNKANYIELRKTLKEIREKIKTVKPEYKDAQRALSACQKNNGSWDSIYKELESLHITKKDFDEKRNTLSKLSSTIYDKLNEKENLRESYRYLHVIYSLARGRTLEQIEPKVREGNELDLKQLNHMKVQWGFDDPDDRVFNKKTEVVTA